MMAPKQRLWNNQALVHEDQLPGATKAKKERQMSRVCISSFCDTVMRVYLGAQLVWEATAEPPSLSLWDTRKQRD